MASKKTATARTSHTTSSAPSRTARGSGKRISARDLKSLRKRLQDELAALKGRHAGLEAAGARSADVAGASGYAEEADAGSYTAERERDLSLAGNLRDLIEKVQGALGRIDDGGYGRCEVCGEAIEPERLDALPYTTLCLADARRRARTR
jgi:RNA polymerase-binding transcription factor DksA